MLRGSILAATLFVASAVYAVDRIPGWDEAKWGMSMAEVRELYPDVRRQGDDVLRLQNVEIVDGITADSVSFQFIGDALRIVTLYLGGNNDGRKTSECGKLWSLLEGKYGKWETGPEQGWGSGSAFSRTRTFKLSASAVAYTEFIDPRYDNPRQCNVEYRGFPSNSRL